MARAGAAGSSTGSAGAKAAVSSSRGPGSIDDAFSRVSARDRHRKVDSAVKPTRDAESLRRSSLDVEQEELEEVLDTVIRKEPTIRSLKRHKDRKHLAMRLVPVLFMVCVFVATVLMQKDIATSYGFEETVKETLLHETHGGTKNFFDVETAADWFEWIDGPFVHFLYDKDWYNGDPKTGVTEHTYLNVNKLLGGVILIQKRVREGTCDKSERFEAYMPKCWGNLKDSNLETEEPFGTEGQFTTSEIHGAEGYIEHLPIEEEGARHKIAELKSGMYIDEATREVDLDFSLYNHNVNLFLVARLKFSFKPTGFVRKEHILHTVRLEPYAEPRDDARLALEIIFILLVVLQIVYEFYRMWVWGYQRKYLVGYFASGWPLVRWLNISMNIALIAVWGRYMEDTLRKDTELPFADDEIVDLEPLAEDAELFLTLAGINMLIFVIVVFETLRFSERFAFVTTTFKIAWPKLWSFLILFVFVFMGFAIMGHILFGHSLEQFSTIYEAMNGTFEIVTGEQQFEPLREVDPISAVIFFYSFLIIIFFLLINVFIAILADAYLTLTSERKYHEFQENKYGPIEYSKEAVKAFTTKGYTFMSDDKAIKFLSDRAFRGTDRILEKEARVVARRKGYPDYFVDQLFGRYSIIDRELSSHERILGSATSLQAAIAAEFDHIPIDEVIDSGDVNELKKRILSHVDEWYGDDGVNEERDAASIIAEVSRYKTGGKIDWESMDLATRGADLSDNDSAGSSAGSSYDSYSSDHSSVSSRGIDIDDIYDDYEDTTTSYDTYV